MVCKMGLVSGHTISFLVGAASKIASKLHSILVFQSSFFSKRFIKFQARQPYYSTDTAYTWKNSYFISSAKLDFLIISALAINDYGFPMCTLTLISVDEILLPKYVEWSTNFRGLPYYPYMTLFGFKILELCFIWDHAEVTPAPSSTSDI